MRTFVLLLCLFCASKIDAAPLRLGDSITDIEYATTENYLNPGRRAQASDESRCLEDAIVNENDLDLTCECVEDDSGTVLDCLEECLFCNEAETVCGLQSAQALYESGTGDRVAVGGVFEYLFGLDDFLAVERTGCEETDGVITTCTGCAVYVNGEECNSCELVVCPTSIIAEQIDCTNIEDGATFDFCDEVIVDDEESVFQAFTTGDGFEECLPLPERGSKKSKRGSSSGKGKGKGGSSKGSSSARRLSRHVRRGH